MNSTFARFTALLLLSALVTAPAAATGAGDDDFAGHSRLSAEQVVSSMLSRNAEREKSLQCYESFRRYRLQYNGFPSSKAAEIEVAMKYAAPDRKEFRIVSEQGSSMLVNRVLKKLLEAEKEAAEQSARFQSSLSPANYSFELAGTDKLDGRAQYVLAVEPLRKDKLLYRGRIWVDTDDFGVAHIEAEPARSPSFWITKTKIVHHYAKVGDFWLPAQNQSESTTRFGGHARLEILYSDYVLNGNEEALQVDRPRGEDHGRR